MPFSSQSAPTQRHRWIISAAERLGLANAPLGLLALVPLCIWFFIQWLQTLVAVIHSYNPLPVWDYWQVTEHFHRYQAFDWSVLWAQHNEHRILFPEIIFAIDALFLHERQVLPQALNLLCYFLLWIVLAAAFYSERTINRLVCTASILLAGVIIGWQGSVVVVGTPFLLQWTMLQLSVMLGLYLLTRGAERQAWLYILGSIACGIVATYSSGNGMLLWPVLILGALLLRIPKAQLFTLAIAAVVSVAVYFIGYQSSNDLNVLAMLRHPFYLAGFLASYLSMPFGAIGNATFALIIGSANLLTFLFALYVARRHGLLRSKLSILLFGSYVFILLTAILTAAGRMNPADHQFIAAKAARYVSLPLVNWAVLLLAVIWLSSSRKWEIFSAGNLLFIAAMMFLAVFHKLDPWLWDNARMTADQQLATLSVESGLLDPTLLSKLYPDPGFVRQSLPVLKQNALSIYRDQPDITWLGHSAKSVFPKTWTKKLQGEVSQVYPIAGGAEITGTEPNIKPGTELVLVDERGEIVGLGERLPAGVPTILSPASDTRLQDDWVAFLNATQNSKEFSVYLVKDRNLTQITDPIAVPKIKEAASGAVGAPFPNITWQASQWILGALPAGAVADSSNQRPFWSSWNGSDASTGQIASTVIPVRANHCMILSVLHGPSVQGLSAEITDAGTNQPVGKIPMQNGETQWKLWRVPIDSKVSSVKILGRDAGRGWGQWLAIGDPLQCR